MRAKRLCRIVVAFALCIALSLLFTGCERNREPSEQWAAKPSVMVNGVLYGTTGRNTTYRTDDTPEKGGHVDGYITSSVEEHEYPTEDGQSNFGVGAAYRFGTDGTIEVFSDSANMWFIYEAYE